MKTIIQKMLAAVALMAIVSCSDDFFEKTPQGSLDPSKIDAELAVGLRNNIYNQIPEGYGSIFTDGFADNGYSRNA